MGYSNHSLSELQNMTREDFTRFFPQNARRWKQHYRVSAKALMRAIISAASQLSWPLTEKRGVREFWYNPVKPILFKAIGERAENYSPAFEKILSDMVKAGEVTYAQLGILDFRTMRELFEANEQAQCWKNILLFVEKDSAYVHLTPLTNLFNINIMSGSGWSNTAGIERILRDLVNKGVTEVVVFTLTDYDPFGFAISQEFADKCKTLGLYVSEHYRIGINIEHATPEILDVQKYPVKTGRKLSVNGVSFDSDRWLAEYGIDRRYGLEIEAISAQPNGHLQLRLIVAKELLKYLQETDRVEEITKKAWENVPYKTIKQLLFSIDEKWMDNAEITYAINFGDHPEGVPKEYLSYQDFINRFVPIQQKMEDETYGITEEIEDLQSQVEDLEQEKAEIEQPYRTEMGLLEDQYLSSKRLLIHCLYVYYESRKDKWPRENYALGFPKGCLVNALKEGKDLAMFIAQVNTTKVVGDIDSALREALSNGEIQRLIFNVLNGDKQDG